MAGSGPRSQLADGHVIIADALVVPTLADRVATTIRCRRRRALGSLGWSDLLSGPAMPMQAPMQAPMLRALEVMP
jgi:hypothetical protein